MRYKDFAWKDLNAIVEPKESVSPRFTMQRVSSLYYGWGATTADINHDGTLDIVSGPFYYLGPGFTERKIYREGRVYNPSTEFAPDMVNLASDFTGDGWPDILSSLGNRHMDLYVNPQGRVAPLGQIQRADDDHDRDRAAQGSRQRRQARSDLRRRRRLRVGEAGSCEPDGRLDAASDFQSPAKRSTVMASASAT